MSDDSTNLAVDEDARRRFESAWQTNPPAQIEEFLPAPDSRVFLGTLEELVQIELEFTWKTGTSRAGTPPLVEYYLLRFPKLNQPDIVHRLLRQERHVRHQYGDRPSGSEYAARFPRLFDKDLKSSTIDSRTFDIAAGLPTDPAETLTDSAPVALPEMPGYDVLKVIGRGGMGIVLQARHRALNRLVAIKLPLHGSLSKSEADRFQREARSVAKLRHANICPIYEVGEHHGRPYIAMGYVDGPTLNKWAKEHEPSARQSAEMVAKIARAVAYAHDHGVIHRDIKPANVLIESETDEPVLTDFGLAKEITSDESLLTQDGSVLGTPAYMSPEQAAGRSDQIGPPTDVYALGAVLYELLCGQPPFLGNVGEILKKVQTEAVMPLRKRAPKVHRDLETVCMKALAQEPNRRYPTARALAEDLDRFSEGEAILARREGVGRKIARLLRRHPLQAASFALILILASSANLFFARGSSRTHRAALLRQQVESRIDAGNWKDEQLADIDALIGELSNLDPQQADIEKARVVQALDKSIGELLRRPTLPADILSRVDQEIHLLSTRAPARAGVLQDTVRKRLRAWEPVYDLAPPFANLNGLPKPELVRVDGGLLVFKPPPDIVKFDYAPLPVSSGCIGNVQLDVELESGWSLDHLPVLVLSSVGEWMPDTHRPTGYSFNLAPGIGNSSGNVIATCARDGNRLRTWELKRSDLGTGPLRLIATRDGDRLSFQINDRPPLVIADSFPPQPCDNPVYAVYLADQTHVRRLRAIRQSNPLVASPLEQGDQLFNANRFPEALAYYQKQVIDSAGSEAGLEARYKQALCLEMLKRDDEAAEQFEQVLAEEGTRWPALAGCQLLLIRVHQDRRPEAGSIFRTLRTRFPSDLLNPLVPEDMRQTLLSIDELTGANIFLRVRPEALDDARQAREFSRLLTPDASSGDLALVRAYELSGLDDPAIAAAEEAFDKGPPNYYTNLIVEDYGSMMRLRGSSAAALQRVDSMLLGGNGDYIKDNIQFLVERARLHAAMNNPAQAEKDLDTYIRLSAESPKSYIDDSQAALIRGFLREDRGDTHGALEDWRYATLRQYAARRHLSAEADFFNQVQGFNSASLILISGSLSDDLPDADIQTLMTRMAASDGMRHQGGFGGAISLMFESGTLHITPSMMREMWRTPHGRKVARQRVFRSLPLGELARQTMTLGIYEYLRAGCSAGELPPDQDAIIWDQSLVVCDAMRDRKLSKGQILKLFLTWNGTTNFLGWGGVEKSLEPGFRAGVAYAFGKRFLFTHNPTEAEKMFHRVLADAPADSPLHHAAETEIQSLGAGHDK